MTFNESDHPRAPAGQPDGGQFIAKAMTVVGKLNKDVATLTAGQVNKELKKLDDISVKVTDAFIASGRGSERPSDRRGKTDPLTLLDRAIQDRSWALRQEVAARMGPGYSTMAPGFKPRKR